MDYILIHKKPTIFLKEIVSALTKRHKDNPKGKEELDPQISTGRSQTDKVIPLQTQKEKGRVTQSMEAKAERAIQELQRIISREKDWALIKELVTSAQVEFRIAIDLHDFVPPDYCHMLGVLGRSKEDKLVSNSQAFISKELCQRMLHLRNHTQGTSISEPDLDSIFV